MDTAPEEHVCQWVYEQREDGAPVLVCRICGACRIPMPWEIAAMSSRELNIRHDGEETDL